MVRIACIGGFLGAGKTTALIEAARNLIARGLSVGVITNDQGHNLVDTALVRGQGLRSEEIVGGCFCCRFTEFVRHANRLVEQHKPDIILAEAVGSCTDLAATVYEPLRRFHAAKFELAPLSVFVEPVRVRDMFDSASGFEASVRYLFEKQLAEAELIILSKGDLLRNDEIAHLTAHLREIVTDVPIHLLSAKNGKGINAWVDKLVGGPSPRDKNLDLDYEIYGKAEASLGWLNATVDFASDREFRPSAVGEALVSKIQEKCRSGNSAIAHLKTLLVTSAGSDRISLTATGSDASWDAAGNLGLAREVSAIINARIAVSPQELQRMVEEALQSTASEKGISVDILDMECFAPAPPQRPVIAAN